MLSPRSRNTKLKISSPLTISTSPAHSPTVVAAPLSPARSITPEIIGPQGKSIDQKPDSPSENRGTNRTLDLFDKNSSDEENIIDEEAVESVSDFSDYPAGSNVGIKSPNPSSRFGNLVTPLTTGTHFGSLGEEPRSRKSSKSSEGSIAAWEAQGRRKGSEISRQEDGIPGSPVADSPTLGRYFSASTKGMKSPAMDSHGKRLSILTGGTKSPKSPKSPRFLSPRSSGFPKSPKSPNPAVDSIGTSSTTPRAEKGLLSPFLPNFLKVLGTPEPKDETHDKKSLRSPSTATPAPHLRSIFDEESSSSSSSIDNLEPSQIGLAKEASVHRPTFLHQSSTNTIGLQEMLRSTGPPPPTPTGLSARLHPGPSAAKVAQILGPEFSVLNGLPAPAPSRTRTATAPTRAPAPSHPENKEPSQHAWRGFNDGLRSHPPPKATDPFMHRSATVPSRKPTPATVTATTFAAVPTGLVRATPGIPEVPASMATLASTGAIASRNANEIASQDVHVHDHGHGHGHGHGHENADANANASENKNELASLKTHISRLDAQTRELGERTREIELRLAGLVRSAGRDDALLRGKGELEGRSGNGGVGGDGDGEIGARSAAQGDVLADKRYVGAGEQSVMRESNTATGSGNGIQPESSTSGFRAWMRGVRKRAGMV